MSHLQQEEYTKSHIEIGGRGRPVSMTLPPRIDASPEEIACAFFRSPSSTSAARRDYMIGDCGRSVLYPEPLYEDGKCSDCPS